MNDDMQKKRRADSKAFRKALCNDPPNWSAAAAALGGDVGNIEKRAYAESLGYLIRTQNIAAETVASFFAGLEKPGHENLRDWLLGMAIAANRAELVPLLTAKGAVIDQAVDLAVDHYGGYGHPARAALFAARRENAALTKAFSAACDRIAQLEARLESMMARLEALEPADPQLGKPPKAAALKKP